MDKERRNGSGAVKKKRKRKNSRDFSYYYTHAVRRLKRHRKEALAATVCVLILCCMAAGVWALVRSLSGKNLKSEIETVEDVAGEPIDTVEPLQKDAYPEVNDFVVRYFTALQEGNEETLTSLRDNTGTADLLRMQENSSHIEAYTNISCYTKSGLTADSYVVFAYYEVKFQGIDTTLPGIAPLYVCRNTDGTYYLHDLTQDEDAAAYVNDIAAQEDVAALYEEVNSEYAARLEEQTAEEESTQETADGTEAASEGGAGESTESSDGEGSSSQGNDGASSGSAGTSSTVPDSGEFTVSETVNIRKGVSETSEKIAVCYPGETLEILMKQADGWTRVRYQGQTGYVRSDVLK